MPELVPMPKLGFEMAEGTLVRKVKKQGENVNKGDVLAEIETDKATVEVESPASGVVKGWVVEEGQAVPVGALMAVIGAADENVDMSAVKETAQEVTKSPAPAGPPPARPKGANGKAEAAAPAQAQAAPAKPAPAADPTSPAPGSPAPAAAPTPPAGAPSGAAAPVSPIARKMAAEA